MLCWCTCQHAIGSKHQAGLAASGTRDLGFKFWSSQKAGSDLGEMRGSENWLSEGLGGPG